MDVSDCHSVRSSSSPSSQSPPPPSPRRVGGDQAEVLLHHCYKAPPLSFDLSPYSSPHLSLRLFGLCLCEYLGGVFTHICIPVLVWSELQGETKILKLKNLRPQDYANYSCIASVRNVCGIPDRSVIFTLTNRTGTGSERRRGGQIVCQD